MVDAVEGEHGVIEVQAQVLAGVHRSGDADQRLRHLGVDSPVASLVRIGQGVARHRATNAHVIKLLPLRTQADLDISQTLPIRKLGERHAQKLAVAREGLDVTVATISAHGATEGVHRQVIGTLVGARWKMTHLDGQSGLVGQLL